MGAYHLHSFLRPWRGCVCDKYWKNSISQSSSCQNFPFRQGSGTLTNGGVKGGRLNKNNVPKRAKMKLYISLRRGWWMMCRLWFLFFLFLGRVDPFIWRGLKQIKGTQSVGDVCKAWIKLSISSYTGKKERNGLSEIATKTWYRIRIHKSVFSECKGNHLRHQWLAIFLQPHFPWILQLFVWTDQPMETIEEGKGEKLA